MRSQVPSAAKSKTMSPASVAPSATVIVPMVPSPPGRKPSSAVSVPGPATVPEIAALATVCDAPQRSSVAPDATESAVSAGNAAAPAPEARTGIAPLPAWIPATISLSVRARFQTRTSSKDPEASSELSHDQPSRRIIDESVAGDQVTEVDFEASTAPVVALRRAIVRSKPLAVFANTSET